MPTKHRPAWGRFNGLVLVSALLCACGGGGSSAVNSTSTSTTTSAVSVPSPVLVPSSAPERAFFSGSYEFVSNSAQGYLLNEAVSSGAANRRYFEFKAASGGYEESKVQILARVGYTPSGTWVNLDGLFLESSASFRSAGAGTFVLSLRAGDWFSIDSVQEVDISGQPFTKYYALSAFKKGGASGVFPAGSSAYTAKWVSLQDLYISSALNVVLPGAYSNHYLSDNYNTPAKGYCMGEDRALVFQSPTAATSYPRVAKTGFTCVADTLSAGTPHAVSARLVADRWFFDFTNNSYLSTNSGDACFSAAGASTKRFAIVIGGSAKDTTDPGQATYFPAGTTGTNLSPLGIRMNKVAINAILAAEGLPLVQ